MDVPLRFLGPLASPYMASMKRDGQTLRPKASKEAKKFGFLKARSLLVPSSALSGVNPWPYLAERKLLSNYESCLTTLFRRGA